MTYTGHKEPTMENGRTLVDWIKETVADECRFFGVPMPTDEQMAVVISSIRMHTIIMRAASYDTSELGKPEEVTKYWPMESSVGRFFRDAARITLDNARSDKK